MRICVCADVLLYIGEREKRHRLSLTIECVVEKKKRRNNCTLVYALEYNETRMVKAQTMVRWLLKLEENRKVDWFDCKHPSFLDIQTYMPFKYLPVLFLILIIFLPSYGVCLINSLQLESILFFRSQTKIFSLRWGENLLSMISIFFFSFSTFIRVKFACVFRILLKNLMRSGRTTNIHPTFSRLCVRHLRACFKCREWNR